VVLANQTLRMNARLSIGGDTVRVRLSNAHGQGKLRVGMATIGVRQAGLGIGALPTRSFSWPCAFDSRTRTVSPMS